MVHQIAVVKGTMINNDCNNYIKKQLKSTNSIITAPWSIAPLKFGSQGERG